MNEIVISDLKLLERGVEFRKLKGTLRSERTSVVNFRCQLGKTVYECIKKKKTL